MYIIKNFLFEAAKTSPVPSTKPQTSKPEDMEIAGVVPASVPEYSQKESNHKPFQYGASVTTAPKSSVKASGFPEPTGFPTLQPAIITKVNIGDVNALGTIHNGSTLTHYGTPTGTIESVPGFEPAFKATVNFGADWLSFDPDGQYGRINLKGMARTEEGQSIDFRYKGIIKMAPGVKKIFEMQPDMETVPFGYATGYHTFLVADPKLKDLENSVFVSNGRIIVSETGLSVETRQSKLISSTVMD